MSGMDYDDWLALRQYRNYLKIHTVPNMDRRPWQFWKPRNIPNPHLHYTKLEFPSIDLREQP